VKVCAGPQMVTPAVGALQQGSVRHGTSLHASSLTLSMYRYPRVPLNSLRLASVLPPSAARAPRSFTALSPLLCLGPSLRRKGQAERTACHAAAGSETVGYSMYTRCTLRSGVCCSLIASLQKFP